MPRRHWLVKIGQKDQRCKEANTLYISFLLCFFSWFRRLSATLFSLSSCVALFDCLFVAMLAWFRSSRFNQRQVHKHCNVCMVILTLSHYFYVCCRFMLLTKTLRVYSKIHYLRYYWCWICVCVLCTFSVCLNED